LASSLLLLLPFEEDVEVDEVVGVEGGGGGCGTLALSTDSLSVEEDVGMSVADEGVLEVVVVVVVVAVVLVLS